jgi:hypothetical protein
LSGEEADTPMRLVKFLFTLLLVRHLPFGRVLSWLVRLAIWGGVGAIAVRYLRQRLSEQIPMPGPTEPSAWLAAARDLTFEQETAGPRSEPAVTAPASTAMPQSPLDPQASPSTTPEPPIERPLDSTIVTETTEPEPLGTPTTQAPHPVTTTTAIPEADTSTTTASLEQETGEAAPAAAAQNAIAAAEGSVGLSSQVGEVPEASMETEFPQWVRGDGSIDCPEDFPVKAKATSMIYHEPGTTHYDVTIPDVCYSSAHDAELGGYRAPKR